MQTELAAAFQASLRAERAMCMSQSSSVSRSTSWATVRNAGTFKHTPGMTVLQALAGAGGTDLGTADTSKAIESIRETERLHQAQDRFDRLLVKQARLIAQRDNSDTMVGAAGQHRLATVGSDVEQRPDFTCR